MTDCATCGHQLKPLDGVTARSFPDGTHPDAEDPAEAYAVEDGYWVHITCTDDGVERWCRAGRPARSPLDWARTNGLNWTGLQKTGVRARLVLE